MSCETLPSNSRKSSRKPAPELAEESEVRPEDIQINLPEALAEEGPDNQEEDEVPLLYSDDSNVPDEETELLRLFGAQDPEDLESLLIPYIPKCIAPEDLDTFLVIHQKTLKYLLSNLSRSS
ncbi:hypothetical protein P9112_003576 [Eukaryota sp. TZLM1-RC]